MTNEEFKAQAREHQTQFKLTKLGIEGIHKTDSPARTLRWKDKNGIRHERTILVESSLLPMHYRDGKGGYVIFYPGFRQEITTELNRLIGSFNPQMISNLLRSEHIPYNVFFPMRKDLEGAAKLFNAILGEYKIKTIDDIKIEYNPGGLMDGTSFDVFIRYTSANGNNGGIGIEVKYTEKEYPIKRGSKEWNETHNDQGIHLADNYLLPTKESNWFISEFIQDVPFSDKARMGNHVVANKYRQIWRNHILGASMILGLCPNEDDKLDEFVSLTVYPSGNGHFDEALWTEYNRKLTGEGRSSVRHLTYEKLFPLMRENFSKKVIPQLNDWIDYLETRYYINENPASL